jgi:hypothetical protein
VSNLTALVVGLSNRNRHQIVRRIEKYGVKVIHINGDRRPIDKYPICDIAVLTICGCSHGAVEDVLTLYRQHDKPYLTTHESFSPIKERFEFFVDAHKRSNDMIADGLRLKHLIYSNFRVGDEFTRKDLVSLIRKTYPSKNGEINLNIDAASQMIRRGADPIFDFKKTQGLYVLDKGQTHGRSYVFKHVDLQDIVRFHKEGMSLVAVRKNHSQAVQKALGEEVTAPCVAQSTPVIEVAAPVVAIKDIAPADKSEVSPVLSDVKTAVGLLLEQIQTMEKMVARGGTEEDVILAKKAREWTSAVPFLSTATPEQLSKLADMCRVMFN